MREDQVAGPTIRAALPGDLRAISELFRFETGDQEKREKDLKLLLEQASGSSALFVAVREGRVLGLCSVTRGACGAEGAPAGIVENLIVHRDYPGQGIGGSLLASVMTWCTKQGVTSMQIISGREKTSALQFYFSRGWTDAGSICLRNGF